MFSGSVLLPGGDATGDCVLRTSDGGAFEAQRAFLCTISPYFAAVFREQFGSQRDVVVGGVRAVVLDALLTYLYTDQLCVSSDNILEVLRAADMLLIEDARKQCLTLLQKTMGIPNCLSLATLTRQYYCPSFTNAVFSFVRGNFDEQCSPFGFRISVRALDQFKNRWPSLFNTDEYQEAIEQALALGPCMCSPNKLLMALLKPEEDPQPTPPANAAPNMALAAAAGINEAGNQLFAEFFLVNAAQVAVNAVPQGGLQAGAATAEPAEPEPAVESMDLKIARCERCGLTNPERWLPRLPTELIYVIGGWSAGQPRATIETFDPQVNRWFEHKDNAFIARAYHGVVLFRRRIYVVGGMKMRLYLRTIESYDLDRGQWYHHSPMHVPRAYVAAAALGEHIYAMGGHTGVERTSTVERYSPRTNQWTMVARMMRRRSDGSACTFKGRLYISGGFNGRKVLESVEEYTPSLDSWSLVRPLPYGRCSHRMIPHGGRLYVIGGFDGRRRLHTVLRSDENLPLSWHKAPPLLCARSTFAVAQLGDDIYVIGTALVSDVECFTPGEKSWRKAKQINGPASAMSAVVITGIQALRKFSARACDAAAYQDREDDDQDLPPGLVAPARILPQMVRSVFGWTLPLLDYCAQAHRQTRASSAGWMVPLVLIMAGTALVSDVERFTPGKRSWRKAKQINAPASGMSAVVITGIQAMRKFSARGECFTMEGMYLYRGSITCSACEGEETPKNRAQRQSFHNGRRLRGTFEDGVTQSVAGFPGDWQGVVSGSGAGCVEPQELLGVLLSTPEQTAQGQLKRTASGRFYNFLGLFVFTFSSPDGCPKAGTYTLVAM
ncbi:hypothetical protein HPB50_021291 [Hyalomma asiaticum]|uniref:Uncharacterized protein n=1 Tax=Hyalomma asiaticum TaxID=266040 RepID=A0ACB7SQ36_HYAAI|nr:hypothetical protein HPB50_021291 [Hyalomma asiaticum]